MINKTKKPEAANFGFFIFDFNFDDVLADRLEAKRTFMQVKIKQTAIYLSCDLQKPSNERLKTKERLQHG